MSRRLDWKWIGIGVLIMFGLNIIAGIVLSLLWAGQVPVEGASGTVTFSGGQIAVAGVVSFLSFAIGGYIVGVKSAGRTILEPGISAAIAVVLGLLIAGNLSLGNIVAGALVPFVAGLLGGWLGERRQGTA